MFNGKTHYFEWAFYSRNCQRVWWEHHGTTCLEILFSIFLLVIPPLGHVHPFSGVPLSCSLLLLVNCHVLLHLYWLVVWTPLKNMKVNWDAYSQYGKINNVPNHQPDYSWLHNFNKHQVQGSAIEIGYPPVGPGIVFSLRCRFTAFQAKRSVSLLKNTVKSWAPAQATRGN